MYNHHWEAWDLLADCLAGQVVEVVQSFLILSNFSAHPGAALKN
jgi:hypothetical protein